MAGAESTLTVNFELLGRQETEFESWEIDSAYLVSTDGFSFTIAPRGNDRSRLRNLELQPVELLVNGASQCIGRIDVTDIGDSSALQCEGRDYIADIVECNVDPLVKFVKDDALGLAMARVLSVCNINGILDADDVALESIRTGKPKKGGGRRKKRSGNSVGDIKPNPGEGIYEFINRLAARHGVTIQPGADRTAITLDAPDYAQSPLYRLTRSDDSIESLRNNIKSGRARRDFSKFPTYALFTGTAATSGKRGNGLSVEFLMQDYISGKSLLPQLQPIMEVGVVGRRKPGDGPTPNGKLYRLLHHRDEHARTEEDLYNAQCRAISERLRDTLTYTATVRGHVDPESGAVWSVGTMVDVQDAIADVNEPLWIARRTLKYSREGATTDLECWRPGSFFLSPEG